MLDLMTHDHCRYCLGTAVIGAALLMLPRPAAPDSHLATGARDAALRATAHLDFKIIIPPVLGLNLDSGPGLHAGGLPVALFGNTPTLTLSSSTRGTSRNLVLTAVAHGVIAAHSYCGVDGAPGVHRVTCTAAMP
jgi:hypothetical protein